jgi:thiamine transport system substrate-binding protein
VRRALAAALALAAVTAACTGSACCPVNPTGPRTVTLLTHDSFDVSKKVLQAFEDRSGITVKVVTAGDAGQLVNRAILSAGDPEGDVLYGIDNNLLQDALDADVFEPYASPRLAAIPDRYELDPEHRVSPVDRGDVCVNVDGPTADTRGFMPGDLRSLALRADQLVVENPATSSPGLAFLLATIAAFGDPGYLDYWAKLRDGGVKVVDGWEQAYFGQFSGAGGGDGTYPYVVSYATSPVAEVVFGDTGTTSNAVLANTCYQQIEFAGILAGTEHEAEARELVDFLLSQPFQDDIPLRMFVYPIADDARLPKVFTRFAVVPPHPFALDPSLVAANRKEWVQRWTDVVLRSGG